MVNSTTSKRRTRKRGVKTKTRKNRNVDYVVAIPTYKRYDIVVKNTLKMLHDGKVPMEKIMIFLASKDEEKPYLESIKKLGSKYIPKYVGTGKKFKFVVGVRGIDNQRKFMVRYFHKNGINNVMFMDDDVSAVDFYDSKVEKFKKVSNVHKLITKGFKRAISKDIYLWGIYPIRNGKFMVQRPEIEDGLVFIVGLFYGQRIRDPETNPDIVPTMKVKEDVENSILHYLKDGAATRFNRYTVRTSYGNVEGGVAADVKEVNLKKVHIEAAKELKRKYPKCGFLKGSTTYGLNFQLKVLK
jgi:hypothetical protein